RNVARELRGSRARVRGDDDSDDLPAGRLAESPGEGRDLGADLREAPVGRRLAVDPDGAGHQMILRSARNATTWRAASSAGSRTTRVAARGGGASAARTIVAVASPPTGPS